MGNVNNICTIKKVFVVEVRDEVEIELYENRQIIRTNSISA